MIKFTAVLLAGFVAANANASTVEANYFAKDGAIESQVCAAAANHGFEAAKKLAAENGIRVARFAPSLYCNGTDIRDIAKRMNSENTAAPAKVALFAKDTQKETQLCIRAVKNGLSNVAGEVRRVSNLRCNGQPIEKFVKRYSQQAAL